MCIVGGRRDLSSNLPRGGRKRTEKSMSALLKLGMEPPAPSTPTNPHQIPSVVRPLRSERNGMTILTSEERRISGQQWRRHQDYRS